MPAEADSVIYITRSPQPQYEDLARALRDIGRGVAESPAIGDGVIADIQTFREWIAAPLDPANISRPDASQRTRLFGKEHIVVEIGEQRYHFAPPDIQAVLNVSDHLDISEFDAVQLIEEARETARYRSDRSITSAALELYCVRRRHSVLFLQEILRSSLTREDSDQGRRFVDMLVRERDRLVTEHNVISRVLARVKFALDALPNNNTDKRNSLPVEELVLLAEALFLLAYTVQFTSSDATTLRSLIDTAGSLYKKECDAAVEAANKMVVSYGSAPTPPPDTRSELRLGLESVRNLLSLSWMCALDRTRYDNKYDARSATDGINQLLQDDGFVRQTSSLPAMDDTMDPYVDKLDQAVLAAELVGAVFRLAVAVPDEEEAKFAALRVCAYGGCLTYLADDLPEWIQNGAGSLAPDADLYSDVLEDLSLDLVETPLPTELVRWHHTEISRIAYDTVRDDFQQKMHSTPRFQDANLNTPARSVGVRTPASTFDPKTPGSLYGNTPGTGFRATTPSSPFAPTTPASPFQPTSPFAPTTPGSGFQSRTPASTLSVTTPGGPTPRGLANPTTPGGKPPLPPTRPSLPPLALPSDTPRPGLLIVKGATPARGASNGATFGVNGDVGNEDPNAAFCLKNNLVAQLARLVARALHLAPHKLERESKFNGPRYWTGMEGPGTGFINKISEAFNDIYEIRQNYPEGGRGIGTAFHEAVEAFLALLAASVGKQNSVHAAQALRFLVNAGDDTISMSCLKRALDGAVEQLLNRPSVRNSGGFNFDRSFYFQPVEAALIGGLVQVVAAAAKGLQDQGGLNAFLAGLGSELASKISNLACYNINHKLEATLINALESLDDRRATANFLSRVTENRAKSLVAYNAGEGEKGVYPVSVAVLRLAESAIRWEEDEYPAESMQLMAEHFAMGKVLNEWARRKYETEYERWALVGAAAKLLLSIGERDENRDRPRMLKVLGLLLMSAPGTGAACTPLRAIFSAAGLLRNCDAGRMPTDQLPTGDLPQTEYHKAYGQTLLVSTAAKGLGSAYREMVNAVTVCAKVVSGLFAISPSEANTKGGLMAESPSDLLVVETKSIIAIATLVVHLDPVHLAAYKYGYSNTACSSVLTLLALAAQRNLKIALLITRSDNTACFPWKSFRASLALILQDACSGYVEAEHVEGGAPILFSALHLVEACLGRDGGSHAGLYLLGINLDTTSRYSSSDEGVLTALLRIMVDPNGFLDSTGRASAAVFVQRLAANTVRKTSYAVLEHLKDFGETTHTYTRGAGVADEMLFKVLDYVASRAVIMSDENRQPDWNAIAQLATACMELSALQIRLFPAEVRSVAVLGEEGDGAPADSAPSPSELYRCIIHMVTGGGAKKATIFDAFRAWYCLLGVRAAIDAENDRFASVPVFLELTNDILQTLGHPRVGPDSDHSVVIRRDGGYVAASSVLACVQYVCTWESRGIPIADALVSNLLVGTIAAAAGLAGSNLDSSRARTVLYAVLLKIAPLARKYVTEESIGRAFGGRVGARQVSGTEAFLTVCCDDAVNSSAPATRAVAIAAVSTVVLMDPTRAVLSLASQSRLRRIIEAAVGHPEYRALIVKSCVRTTLEVNSANPHIAKERAAKVIADATIALVQAVATVQNGARAVIDAGAVEALSGLLYALNEAQLETFDRESRDHAAFGTAERKAALAAAVADALAAAITQPDAALVAAAYDAIDKGRVCFSDAFRHLREGHPTALDATAACGAVLSRIPAELANRDVAPTQLRANLASLLHVFVGNEMHIGSGIHQRNPAEEEELNDARVTHPLGGTLFDRAEAARRVRACHAVMAALRSGGTSSDGAPLFKPTLATDAAPGALADVLRVCRAALADVARYADDALRTRALADADLGDRRDAVTLLAMRRYGLAHGATLHAPDSVLAECLRREADAIRAIADRCLALFEGSLCVLRDYVRAAKATTTGAPRGDAPSIGASEAVQLLEQAREYLLPLCKDVDAIGRAAWGGKDAGFCKQLSRQIRSAVVR